MSACGRCLFSALILVKKAAALANRGSGLLSEALADAVSAAADEVLEDIERYIPPLHPLQGGAGTSVNMAAMSCWPIWL
jgi:aspartate ammonia-lyase